MRTGATHGYADPQKGGNTCPFFCSMFRMRIPIVESDHLICSGNSTTHLAKIIGISGRRASASRELYEHILFSKPFPQCDFINFTDTGFGNFIDKFKLVGDTIFWNLPIVNKFHHE
jgi:hypothetical protein